MQLMNRLFMWLVVAVALSVSACQHDKDNDQSEVKLRFNSTYAGAPLVMYEPVYEYVEGMKMKAQLFQFYVSDIELVQANGQAVRLSEIELISFSDDLNEAQAQEGYLRTYADIPAGQYERIRFGLGISPDLNATQPGNYSPNHPLADNYWSWALGYIFSKIEGVADVDGDGVFSEKLTFHTGADELYRVLEFEGPFVVPANGDDVEINFEVDLKEVLVKGNQFIDFRIPDDTQDHNTDEDVYRFIWANLSDAVRLK